MQIEKQGNLFLNAKIYIMVFLHACVKKTKTRKVVERRGASSGEDARIKQMVEKRFLSVCEMLCFTPFPTTEVDFSQKCGGGTVLKANDATKNTS